MKTSVMIGGEEEEEERMEGWLYLIRSNRFGLQSSRRRYFVLQDHVFKCFKSIPSSDHESPVRSVIIDSCIRVTGSGRESIHRKVFFIFSLYNTSNHNDQLKLGASSPEEAARWIHSFKEAALKSGSNVGCSKNYWQSFRYDKHIQHCYRNSSSSWVRSIGWTLCSSTCRDSAIDVIAPSTWTIFGCHNGLRLFEEAKDRDSRGKWDDHPAIMAVGVVDTTSEAIFQTLMSLGPSRSEWDFCFYKGSVVEHLDGHTDIVHKQLYGDWLPWGMKRRDFLLRRCWRREDDGKYVILYHSVFHENCPPQKGYVRACLKSGGYVISPLNQGERSVVKHMLVIDWKFWKSYIQTSSAQSITIRMLGRVAALRELFIAKRGNCPPDFSSGELDCNILDGPTSPTEATTKEHTSEEVDKTPSNHASLVGLNDAADEFFDVPEPSDDERTGNGWSYAYSPEIYPQVPRNKLFIV